jgi:DNA-binding LacI/PurR family transcriptional regulator
LKASDKREKRVNQKTILMPKLIIRESCAQLKN